MDWLDLLASLLDWCDDEQFVLHEEMSRFDARRLKSRVRGFVRKVFEATMDIELAWEYVAILDVLLVAPFDQPLPTMAAYVERIEQVVRNVEGLTDKQGLLDAASGIGSDFPSDADFPTRRVVIARAIALAIDDTAQACYVDSLKRRSPSGTAIVAQGTVIPCKSTESWYDRTLRAYRTDRTDDIAGHLPHARRIRPPLAVRVELDTRDTIGMRQLARFVDPQGSRRERRIGFACLGPCEFHNSHIITKVGGVHEYAGWEQHPEDRLARIKTEGLKEFRGVYWNGSTPERIESIVRQAQQRKVDLLLFPELTLTSESELALRNALSNIPSAEEVYPSLVIGGSRHLVVDSGRDRWRNRLIGLATKDPAIRTPSYVSFHHDKIGTFLYPEGPYNVIEAVERPRTLRVALCKGVLTAFLICKDALQASVIDAIQATGVRRLIVVAMSERTDEFAFHLSELAVRCGTHSWFACATVGGEITAGVFGPGRNRTAMLLRNRASTVASSVVPTETAGGPPDGAQAEREIAFGPFAALSEENPRRVDQDSLWVVTMPIGPSMPTDGWFQPVDP